MDRTHNDSERFIDKQPLKNYWYVVALGNDLGLNPISVKLLNEDFVIWRDSDGDLIAAKEKCPHRQAPLSHGSLENGCLVCPYHGWTFGKSGKCVNIPSSADGVPISSRSHLKTFDVIEKYGLIWLCIGKPDKPLFDLKEESDSSFRRINRLGVSDVVLWPDAYQLQVLAAQATEKIMIGSMVTNPYTRHPSVHAASLATLNDVSNGRAFCGIGIGAGLEEIGISPEKPVLKLRETIEAIRNLLTGEKVTSQGATVRLDGARLARKRVKQ